jgi:peptide deformylase
MKIIINLKTLRKISEPVEIDEGIKIIKKLRHVSNRCEQLHMGLSAIQIGIPKRVIFINYRGKVIYDIINPEIIKQDKKQVGYREGCLSIPETMEVNGQIPVYRSRRIKVKFTDAEKKTQVLKFDGIIGRAILHEIDHLNGKLITDYKED